MSMLEKFKELFSVPDQDEIIAYQYKIPKSITVSVNKKDGLYLAKVEKINDELLSSTTFLTEADTLTELIKDVNDMLLTYLDFPENIKSKMPQLLPPAEFFEKEGVSLKSSAHKELVFAR